MYIKNRIKKKKKKNCNNRNINSDNKTNTIISSPVLYSKCVLYWQKSGNHQVGHQKELIRIFGDPCWASCDSQAESVIHACTHAPTQVTP